MKLIIFRLTEIRKVTANNTKKLNACIAHISLSLFSSNSLTLIKVFFKEGSTVCKDFARSYCIILVGRRDVTCLMHFEVDCGCITFVILLYQFENTTKFVSVVPNVKPSVTVIILKMRELLWDKKGLLKLIDHISTLKSVSIRA